MEDLRRAIGKRARQARTALEMTQADVAEAVGISPEVYGRLERGLMMPSVPTLTRLARALRVSPDELLGWEGVRKKKNPPEVDRLMAIVESADRPALRRLLLIVRAAMGDTKPPGRPRR